MSLFEMQNVSFSSRTTDIIRNVNLSFEEGSSAVFIGQSGCGKSTLLKLLAGILVPSEGRVLYNGKDIELMTDAENREFRKNCAFVFQDSALWANQNIFQNLCLPLEVHYPKMKKKELLLAVQEVCRMINYNKSLKLRPSDLSAGEQKMIAFARAIICKPKVLFVDELTSGLDEKNVDLVVSLLHNFADEGNSLFYISHGMAFISEFPAKMIHVENGRIVK